MQRSDSSKPRSDRNSEQYQRPLEGNCYNHRLSCERSGYPPDHLSAQPEKGAADRESVWIPQITPSEDLADWSKAPDC